MKNAKQLVALAKARPDKLTYGTSGAGSMSHFAGECSSGAGDRDDRAVNYKGSAQSITELMGGQISMMFSDALPAMPNMKSGKIRALAVTSDEALAVYARAADLHRGRTQGFRSRELVGHPVPDGGAARHRRQSERGHGEGARDGGREGKARRLRRRAVSSTPEEFGKYMDSEPRNGGSSSRRRTSDSTEPET